MPALLCADLAELSTDCSSDDDKEEHAERENQADAQNCSPGRQGYRLCSKCGHRHHCRSKCGACGTGLLVSAQTGAGAPDTRQNENKGHGKEAVGQKEEETQEPRNCMNAAIADLSAESDKLPSFRFVRPTNLSARACA